LRDGNGPVLLTILSMPLGLFEGLSFRMGVPSDLGEQLSFQLLKLVLDVADVALRIVETQLLAEWRVFMKCARGEAQIFVRGDLGGTFGGMSPFPPRATGRYASVACAQPRFDGMINGFNFFKTNNHDRLSAWFQGGSVACKQSVIPSF